MKMLAQPTSRALTALLAAVLLAAAGVALGACGGDEVDDPDTPVDAGGPADPDEHDPDLPELPQNDDLERVQCTAEPQGVFDATEVVGESLADAEEAAAEEGCSVREVERDGESLAATQDFRPDRINVATEDGHVTAIVDLG